MCTFVVVADTIKAAILVGQFIFSCIELGESSVVRSKRRVQQMLTIMIAVRNLLKLLVSILFEIA